MNNIRKSGTSQGENIWNGFKVSLKPSMKDPNVQGFILENEGLFKSLRVGNPELIAPIGPCVEKLEREFYQPSGKKLNIDIKNKGKFG